MTGDFPVGTPLGQVFANRVRGNRLQLAGDLVAQHNRWRVQSTLKLHANCARRLTKLRFLQKSTWNIWKTKLKQFIKKSLSFLAHKLPSIIIVRGRWRFVLGTTIFKKKQRANNLKSYVAYCCVQITTRNTDVLSQNGPRLQKFKIAKKNN